jgi:hypothetical protein
MDATGHTPEPWEWVETDPGSQFSSCQLIGANGKIILDDGSAYGEYGRMIDPTRGGPEDKANGALISAAPETAAERDRLQVVGAELVVALDAVTDCLTCLVGKYGRDIYTDQALTLARAALAAAKGGA